MKKAILGNWNFVRFLRLVLGIAVVIQGIISKEWLLGILGILFTSMPIFNIGCCSGNNCTVPANKKTQIKKDFIHEEVVK
ncbi:MAG: hypothetical protein V4557_14875 [Bacteroidota bacterium]